MITVLKTETREISRPINRPVGFNRSRKKRPALWLSDSESGTNTQRRMSETQSPPRISIVIPVYNEEAILRSAIVDLRERLSPLGWKYEVIIAENGSRDKTAELARALCDKYPELRALSTGEPNYGNELRDGIRAASGEIVLCD